MAIDNNVSKNIMADFEPVITPKSIHDHALVFVYSGSKLLLLDNKIPNFETLSQAKIKTNMHRFIGKIASTDCFIMQLDQKEEDLGSGELLPIRPLIMTLTDVELKAAMYGFQVQDWDKKSNFCGQCGNKTENNTIELLKTCSVCKAEFYPRISPAIIVSVVKDDQLLMAHHTRSKEKIFAVLAGFVSPGETLEECVHREVKEEANIEIKNIKYFGSQPWPFPDSLMVAFTAEYQSGTIKPDKSEIEELKWFKRDEIEEWPVKYSISWKLIEKFIENK